MISPDVPSFIHNAVCSLSEVEERGSDLEINQIQLILLRFPLGEEPTCSTNPAEGISHLHFRDLADALISCQ